MPLRKITAEAFARRLKETSKESDKRYALFLGAGCSVSSGIPTAGSLVRDEWLPRLHRFDEPEREFDEWVREAFPKYDPACPAASYGPAMERLFLTSEERQREVERLCEGRFPGFGYATLASLVALPGGAFNVVLTTNFDDLIADALYLFTRARPLVIHHESLAGFIRSTRTRPLVVKVHGDNRLAPRNTVEETGSLKEDVQRQIANLLHDRGLIFIGYSGNDRGIADMLASLHENALPLGVFWVNGEEPRGAVRKWLDAKNAVWVEKTDFDEFMLLIRDAFELPHPEQRRFDEVFKKYKSTYEELSRRIVARASSEPGAAALKEAVKRTDRSFPTWYAVEFEASRLAERDPDAANEIYQRGLAQFPTSAPLLGSYAEFLTDVRKDHDRAEEFYRRALDADPDNAGNLGSYATFLTDVRKDYDRAEELFRRALDADPDDADNLGNYANFLTNVRKDHDRAEEFYRRALDTDLDDASNLGNYASFLTEVRKDHDRAEELFRRALDADPDDADNLGNYANFLTDVRKDHDRAEELYRRALDTDPKHTYHLSNYAVFLKDVRKDHDRAEEFYRRSLDTDPNDADSLGNYAGFLLGRGRAKEGMILLDRAAKAENASAGLPVELLFYRLCHDRENQRLETIRDLKKELTRGTRSPGWNFSMNLEQAQKEGNPDLKWLQVLAAVISEGADLSSLNGWDEWENA